MRHLKSRLFTCRFLSLVFAFLLLNGGVVGVIFMYAPKAYANSVNVSAYAYGCTVMDIKITSSGADSYQIIRNGTLVASMIAAGANGSETHFVDSLIGTSVSAFSY